ncbi:MAG: MATE family efflux transporter, partial [Bacilli bacterium]
LQLLTTAFATGLAIGTMSLVAKSLGEKNQDKASSFARTGIVLTLINSIIFIIIGFFFTNNYMSLFTNDQEIIKLGTQYLSIVLIFSFGTFLDIMLGRILQATGNMKVPMISQIIGSLTNIILDPIFIFGLAFIPGLGIQGAAIATVIGQFAALGYTVYKFISTKQEVSISLTNFKLERNYASGIYKIGISIIAMQSLIPVTNTLINMIIKTNGLAVIAALGVFIKLNSFLTMPLIGLSQGGLPILAYNYGAGNKERFFTTIKMMILFAVSIMLVGVIVFNAFSTQLISLFTNNPDIITNGTNIIRIMSLSFVLIAINFIIAISFQSIGKPQYAFMMALIRQIIVLVPVAWLLNNYQGVNYVWYAYAIAEVVGLILFVPLALRTYRNLFK